MGWDKPLPSQLLAYVIFTKRSFTGGFIYWTSLTTAKTSPLHLHGARCDIPHTPPWGDMLQITPANTVAKMLLIASPCAVGKGSAVCLRNTGIIVEDCQVTDPNCLFLLITPPLCDGLDSPLPCTGTDARVEQTHFDQAVFHPSCMGGKGDRGPGSQVV